MSILVKDGQKELTIHSIERVTALDNALEAVGVLCSAIAEVCLRWSDKYLRRRART